jgi:hypothetical protein
MLPDTTYLMRHVLNDGTASAPLTFRTGPLPTNLTFPTFTVERAPAPGTDLTQDIVFHVGIGGPPATVDTLATDRMGNVLWYYDPVVNGFPSFAPSLAPGGSILLIGGQPNQTGGASTLREVDLAGDTLRETNIDAINAQLAALGQSSIIDINHDAQRLPNGDTAVLATSPRTIKIRGRSTPYNGDMVLVLDRDFQVSWVWDPFQWLNPRRLPTLGERPSNWTHANSVAWSPADGNLLVSLRSQDWAIKINYANGTGDGHVIWRLGPGGDFQINSTDRSPWFSHQHDVRYINNTTLVLFDNGNTRQARNPRAHSRGQELILDEATGVATLVVNADLGSYAPFTGSAQKLPNGNLVFDSPITRRTIEVFPGGQNAYVMNMNIPGEQPQYRSYIFDTLYGNPANSALPSTPIPQRLARRLAVLERQAVIRQHRRAHPQAIDQSRPAVLSRHASQFALRA